MFMCEPRWIYTQHIQSGVLGRQTRVSNPLTLKLQAARSCHVTTGNRTLVLYRSAMLQHWFSLLSTGNERIFRKQCSPFHPQVLFPLSVSLYVKPNYLYCNYPSIMCGDMSQESTGIFQVSAFHLCTPFLKCSSYTMC